MKKRYLTNNDIKHLCLNVIREVNVQYWKPNVIVAPARGGLQAGVMLSHYFNCPMIPLHLSTRDFISNEQDSQYKKILGRSLAYGSVLVVDDINDTGSTIKRIRQIYSGLDYPADDVRYAVLLEKLSSQCSADFVGEEIGEDRDREWIVFPYEDWWQR